MANPSLRQRLKLYWDLVSLHRDTIIGAVFILILLTLSAVCFIRAEPQQGLIMLAVSSLFGILAYMHFVILRYRMRLQVRAELRRRNYCPHCEYDLRASDARCPECGWMAPVRRLRKPPPKKTPVVAEKSPSREKIVLGLVYSCFVSLFVFLVVGIAAYGSWRSFAEDNMPAGCVLAAVSLLAFAMWWHKFLGFREQVRTGMKEELSRRNCCPRCEFDLRASANRCPECGLAIKAESVEV